MFDSEHSLGMWKRRILVFGYLETKYVYPNMGVLPCNHCCSGKAIRIRYSDYVYVALGIQRAMRIRYVVIRGVPVSTKFVHIIS
jgi:hypothetical protein